jgi:hypothetical protein
MVLLMAVPGAAITLPLSAAEALSGSQLLKAAGRLLLVSTAVTAMTLGHDAGKYPAHAQHTILDAPTSQMRCMCK